MSDARFYSIADVLLGPCGHLWSPHLGETCHACRRIATLEARLARVLGAARELKFAAWELAGARHSKRGHVWSGSRSRSPRGER